MATTGDRLRGEGNAPGWAYPIIELVAAHHEREDRPRLCWRYSKTEHLSSGVTKHLKDNPNNVPPVIVVTAGVCNMDALLTLVHECAHWIAGSHAAHGTAWARIAWRLYKVVGVPLDYAMLRDGRYMRTAFDVGRLLYFDELAWSTVAYVSEYWASGRRTCCEVFKYSPTRYQTSASLLTIIGY